MKKKQINVFYILFIFITIAILISCKSVNPYIKYNYLNGGTLINDTLNISAKLFGDIKYHPIKRKEIKKKIRGVKKLKYKDVLLSGTTYISPFYDILFFYTKQKNVISDSIQTNLLLKDTLNNRVLFKKNLDNKTVYLYLKSVNSIKKNIPLILDAEDIISSVRFDTLIKSELTYSKIFYSNIDNDNYLYVKNKFETAPIKQSKRSDWDKFQYLATVLSHDASNKEHKELLAKFELKRKAYFQPIIDSVIIFDTNEKIVTYNKNVIKKISVLAKSNQVFMLNENHWYPNHRILATKLLAPLKESDYTYLAIEAVDRYKDTLLVNNKNTELFGKRNYPTKSTGYYTREPYFGIFIREALNLGYKIISYDYSDGEEREISQAKNIKKIIDKDPNAKIFVYTGLDHIYEGNTKGTKRMAEYFNEITNINPLTIDQTHLFGDSKNELSLFNANLFEGEDRLNTDVDYLLINNINPTLDEIFEKDKMRSFSIVEKELNNYLNKEILISIYYFEEYKKYKSSSVPLFNKITKVTNDQIDLRLPIGNYYLKIRDKNDNTIILKEINVNELE